MVTHLCRKGWMHHPFVYFTLAPCFLVSPGRSARNLPGTSGICQILTRFLQDSCYSPLGSQWSWQIPGRFLADSWQTPCSKEFLVIPGIYGQIGRNLVGIW